MSTALAIAATTRVLSQIIEANIEAAGIESLLGTSTGSPPYVVSQAPDQLETSPAEVTQLSLFLYHVTFNSGWREVGLPSRNGAGAGVDRPPLALDLHYLLTAYGAGGLVPQVLLGLGMQALHETPVLYRSQITSVFTPPPPPTPPPGLNQVDQFLATAQLADQVEMIKVTPEPLSTEDLSKLWTALGGKFRPSAGYEATVVLIESKSTIQPALPVLSRTVTTILLGPPNIAAVAPQFLPWQSTLSLGLTGSNLTGEGIVVVFDAAPQSPETPTAVGPGGASVTVKVPQALPAGSNTLRVVRQLAVGAPPVKNVVQSNVAMFYLQPVIRTGANDLRAGPSDPATNTTPVQVNLDPPLVSTQSVQLLLNELQPPTEPPLAYSFDADPAQIAANTVTFTTFGTRPGPHLVRVQVDGAQSPVNVDPATKELALPAVTL